MVVIVVIIPYFPMGSYRDYSTPKRFSREWRNGVQL